MSLADEIQELAGVAGELLADTEHHLAVVEVLSGGGLCYALSQLPEHHNWFTRGYVANTNAVLGEMLALSPATFVDGDLLIREVFSVVRENSKADLIMVNLYSDDRLGQVNVHQAMPAWLGWSSGKQEHIISLCNFEGDYTRVQKEVILQSLQGLINLLQDALE